MRDSTILLIETTNGRIGKNLKETRAEGEETLLITRNETICWGLEGGKGRRELTVLNLSHSRAKRKRECTHT